MRPSELHEFLPRIQHEINAQRQYDADWMTIQEPVRQLSERLKIVRTSLKELVNELPFSDIACATLPIALRRIEITEEKLLRPTKSANVVEVEILPMAYWRDLEYRPTTDLEVSTGVEFKLNFYVRTDLAKAKRRSLHSEVTYGEGKDKGMQVGMRRSPSHKGVMAPPLDYSGAEDSRTMQDFKDKYLPARTTEIEAIENSVAWIKQALHNTELNPWYPKFLEERRYQEQQRLAESLRENSAQREAESQAAEAQISKRGLSRFLPRRNQ